MDHLSALLHQISPHRRCLLSGRGVLAEWLADQKIPWSKNHGVGANQQEGCQFGTPLHQHAACRHPVTSAVLIPSNAMTCGEPGGGGSRSIRFASR
jgi:hypothetical protein